MKLIIDIPENTINEIRDNAMFAKEIASSIKWDITGAIVNGTPLDKHDEEVIAETVESIWGKPPYRDMLDKIRAEITEYAIPDFEYHGCGGSQKIVELEDVFEIIDKYKAESEEYCDRNICLKNEYNGIGCDECEVTKSQKPQAEREDEE